MFDIGFWELAIIFVVALVVVGPERLPGMVKTAGRLVGRAQRAARDLKYEIEREAEIQEIKKFGDAVRHGNLDDVANKALGVESDESPRDERNNDI